MSDQAMKMISRQDLDLLKRQTYCNLKELLFKCDKDQNFEPIHELGVSIKSIDGRQVPILNMAVESELLHVVECLVDNGVNADETDTEGNTVLHALSLCRIKKIAFKIEDWWETLGHGWMPLNSEDQSPIIKSSFNNNEIATSVLLWRLKKNDFNGVPVLQIAIRRKFHKGLEELIEWHRRKKASPFVLTSGTGLSPFQEAIRVKDSKALVLLFAAEDLFDDRESLIEGIVPDLVDCGELDIISVAWNHLREDLKTHYITVWKNIAKFHVSVQNQERARMHHELNDCQIRQLIGPPGIFNKKEQIQWHKSSLL